MFTKDQLEKLQSWVNDNQDKRRSVEISIDNQKCLKIRAWVYDYDIGKGDFVYPESFDIPDLNQVKEEAEKEELERLLLKAKNKADRLMEEANGEI